LEIWHEHHPTHARHDGKPVQAGEVCQPDFGGLVRPFSCASSLAQRGHRALPSTGLDAQLGAKTKAGAIFKAEADSQTAPDRRGTSAFTPTCAASTIATAFA